MHPWPGGCSHGPGQGQAHTMAHRCETGRATSRATGRGKVRGTGRGRGRGRGHTQGHRQTPEQKQGHQGGGGPGCIRRGGEGGRGLKGRGGGFGWDPPSSWGPSMVPVKGGPKILKLNSSWHRRHLSKILAQTLEGEEGGGPGGVPPLLLRCAAVLIHPWEEGPGCCCCFFGGGWGWGTQKFVYQKRPEEVLPFSERRFLTHCKKCGEETGGGSRRGEGGEALPERPACAQLRLPESKCQPQWDLQPTVTAPNRFGNLLQPPA